MAPTLALLLAAAATAVASAATYTNPVIPVEDTPDPGVVFDAEAGVYIAATTSTHALPAGIFPIHTAPADNPSNWTLVGHIFPGTSRSAWMVQDFWAPEIHILPPGQPFRYVAYFVARRPDGVLSVGCALAAHYLGPWVDPLKAPLVGLPSMGVIDPTYFYDSSSARSWLVVKEDGNAVGKPTPLYAIEITTNGTALVSGPTPSSWTQLLVNNATSWEGVLIEAPWVVTHGGYYYLFYSGNMMADYAVGVARSKSLLGPYERCPANPLMHTDRTVAQPPLIGPGHCSVVRTPASNWLLAYHTWYWSSNINFNEPRHVTLDELVFDEASGWPAVAGGRTVPAVGPLPLPQ